MRHAPCLLCIWVHSLQRVRALCPQATRALPAPAVFVPHSCTVTHLSANPTVPTPHQGVSGSLRPWLVSTCYPSEACQCPCFRALLTLARVLSQWTMGCGLLLPRVVWKWEGVSPVALLCRLLHSQSWPDKPECVSSQREAAAGGFPSRCTFQALEAWSPFSCRVALQKQPDVFSSVTTGHI